MCARAAADWRSDAPYRALPGCDAALFAWEWLRRNPGYRRAASRDRKGDAARFGLHRFEDADCPASEARVWWRADADPAVLSAAAEPSTGPDTFDLARVAGMASIEADANGAEHLLLVDGRHALRIDIRTGTLRLGPVRLAWRIDGLEAALVPMATLKRFVGLQRTGTLGPASYPSPAIARRWALLLRVHDALADGASQREIARTLFGAGIVGERWRVEASAYRLRTQRLAQAATRMGRQDPARLLHPPGVVATRLTPSKPANPDI